MASNKQFEIKVDSSEVIKAKFMNTLNELEGYVTESRGDMEIGTTYSARAVHTRMSKIKDKLMSDIYELAKDIKCS